MLTVRGKNSYKLRYKIVVNYKLIILCRFREKWEKKNIKFHDNGTVSFNQEKIYHFDESQSVGSEDDVVVVPNIPMLVRNPTENLFTYRFIIATFTTFGGLESGLAGGTKRCRSFWSFFPKFQTGPLLFHFLPTL